MTTDERDRADIAALRQALEAAENALDPEAVAALLTEDAVFIVPDYPVQEGKEACAAFMRDVMGWLSAHVARQIVYVSDEVAVDGDVASDRGTFSFTVSPKAGGEGTLVTGKYLFLLRRVSEGWRAARLAVVRDSDPEQVGAE